MGKRPLEGLRVLEFADHTSGYMCTAQLFDAGAEIIQVEDLNGRDARSVMPTVNETSTLQVSLNRGKKSIALDFSKPGSIEVILKLAEKSDIIVANKMQGEMTALGLGFDTIKKINPRIVYTAISGYGDTGPLKDMPENELMIQALSGYMSLTGPKDGEWSRVGVDIAEYIGGVYSAIATLLGLIKLKSTGEGCYLDMSVFDSFMCIAENGVHSYLNGGVVRRPIGSKHPQGCLFEAVDTKDGHMICCCGVNHQFDKFCNLVGVFNMLDNPDYQSSSSRRKHDQEILAVLAPKIKEFTTKELVSMCVEEKLPVGGLSTVAQAVEDEQIKARKDIIDVTDRSGKIYHVVGSPLKCSAFEFPSFAYSAQRGEHNEDILRSVLGLNENEAGQVISSCC